MKTLLTRLTNLEPRLFWQLSLAFAALTLLLGGGMFAVWRIALTQYGPAFPDGAWMLRGCLGALDQYYAAHGEWAGADSVLNDRPCRHGWFPGPRPRETLLLADATGRIVATNSAAGAAARLGQPLAPAEQAQALPVLSQQRLTGQLYSSEASNFGSRFFEGLLWMGGALMGLTLVAGVVLSQRISSPLARLTHASQALAAGDLGVRVTVRGRGEMRNLALAFNQMADQMEQTIVTLRHFVSDAAHEINTPLMALRTNLELAPQAEAVQQALAQAQRLEQLTAALLDLARLEGDAGVASRTRVALPALLQAVGELYASRAEQAGLAFDLTLPAAPLTVLGDAAQLRRAIGNLLENALKFTPAAGRVALTLQPAAREAVICVEDTGIGVPPEDLPRLFERFHRGRNAHPYPGNGLGLAIVKAITEAHGGRVRVESTPGQGTKFCLTLPSADSS